ncbi:MAG TPA: RHS repeat-associated core domain-containing protein [Fimbriimonadaceae bacterium]|nr:RHS repeat-associated core domain-containing protein [Fimbriimonadaceae bacterium]
MPSYLYVGGPTSQVDWKDESNSTVRTVSFTYGAEGELLSRSGAGEAVSLTYDPLYRTHTLSDGASNATTYTYDTSGRLTQVDYPGATGTYTDRVKYTSYDAVNNLLTRFDGNGQETDYTYGDTDGLLSAVSYPGATSNNVSLGYDSYDRMTSLTDATGSAAVSSYDDLNNVLTSSRTYTGMSAKSFTYTFYPDGARNTMVNPAGTWTYYYDADGRYSSMSSPVGTSYASYYDNGWQQTRTLPDGAETDYTYNAVGALTDLLNKTSGGTTLSHYNSFGYDGIFETTGLTASVPAATSQGGATTWSYTTLNQLQQEASARSGGYTQNFAYDSSGNPTTFKGTTQSFNSDNQQTGTGFAYDGNGSPTTYKGTTLTFDPENRLTGIGASWSATYRADGLRASKTASGATTYYLYDGGEPVCELNSSGTLIAYNVFAPDGLVARRKVAVPTWTEYTFDPQGSVAQRLDASQNIITSSYYDAYGVETTTGTPTDQFGYNGQSGYYLDRETGLYLCQNRYFDPAGGRWITRDPIDYDGGINVYGYCGSGPVMAADPTGEIVPLLIVGAVLLVGLLSSEVAEAPTTDESPDDFNRHRAQLGGIKALGALEILGAMIPGANECELEVSTTTAIEESSTAPTIEEVTLSRGKYPESAEHIEDATANGSPDELTIDRSGAAGRRREALKGTDPSKGLDRDEYPPAWSKEGGSGSSVRKIPSSDNRGSGASIGNQIRKWPDGTRVKIKILP